MKKTNNKGFSLVELIIVIAIMAILIGVLAPQYIKYVEKSRVSADKDLLDSIYNACTIAASDPDVTKDVPSSSTTDDWWDNIEVKENPTDEDLKSFYVVVGDTLGCTIEDIEGKLKSKDAKRATAGGDPADDATITIEVGSNGDFTVTAGQITVPETGAAAADS